MKTYKVLLETKHPALKGKHFGKLQARNMEDAKKKASRWENEYNKVLAIVEEKNNETRS